LCHSAGQLLSLLFEDLFKRFNAQIQKSATDKLSRAARAGPYDVAATDLKGLTYIITQGLSNAISTGIKP